MTGGGHRGGQGQDPSKSTAMYSSIGGFLNSTSFRFLFPPLFRERLSTQPRLLAICGCNKHCLMPRRCVWQETTTTIRKCWFFHVYTCPRCIPSIENRGPNAIFGGTSITARNPTSPSPLETATMTCFGSVSGSGLCPWHWLRILDQIFPHRGRG